MRSVKVVAARLKDGKVKSLGQKCHISVPEYSANIKFMTQAVQESFDKPDLAIVTSDGLEILDMPGTRGISF